MGQASWNLNRQLTMKTPLLIETDEPGQDALQGIVYETVNKINLADSTYSMDFKLIDNDCECPTCAQNFTRAYLHHLYHHTPLLCQRFLIQHNVFQLMKSFE